MFWESIPEPCDMCQCTSLFRNGFKIKGTPENTVKKSTGARRLLGMASRRFNSPELGAKSLFSPSTGKRERSALKSPGKIDCSPAKFPKTLKTRFPLEDCDPNSQDSDYDAGFSDENMHTNFQFAEPLGVAPRRLSLDPCSPVKSPHKMSPMKSPSSASPSTQIQPWHFRSLSSGYESTDDGFNELIEMTSFDDEVTRLPNGLSSLISGHLVSSADNSMECDVATTPETVKAKPIPISNTGKSIVAKRSLYQQNERLHDKNVCGTPPMSKVRSCLFRSPNSSCSTAKLTFESSPRTSLIDSPVRSLKRQESPSQYDQILVKRVRKCTSFQEGRPVKKPSSFTTVLEHEPLDTEAHANIKSAVHRSITDADLTGDFSKPCILPLAQGQHQDLKAISGETLANLIRGQYATDVNHFTIIDCRYPYEFEAGHIEGALNLYTQELIASSLLEPKNTTPLIDPDCQKRNIIVFHCEFSWERGPNLSRFLRNLDRQRNKEHYPALHYPEIYLLHGGYHQFHQDYNNMCSPNGYRPMRHPDHEADLRMFRSKSKSWQGEKVNRSHAVTARANLKRLGF